MDQFPNCPPLFETSLALPYEPTDTTLEIASPMMLNGANFSGLCCLSIDIGQPNPQYDIGTLAGTVFTVLIKNVDPLTLAAGPIPLQTHRRGADVKITDFATIQQVVNFLNGKLTLSNTISGVAAVLANDFVILSQLQSAIINGGLPATNLLMGIVRLSVAANTILGNPTITIASPAVITLANHGLILGDLVIFTTTGTLPTGILPGVVYHVISPGLTSNTFEISTTDGGPAVNTTGTQAGTHTLTRVTPIVVGTNDPRMLTQDQKDAAAGMSGNPNSINRYETENDTSNGSTQTAITISFNAGTKTISDSGSGFLTANFRPGDSVVVTGSVSNNGTYTIVSVAAGAIVVLESLVNEVVGASVTIATVLINKLLRLTALGKVPTTAKVNLPNGTEGILPESQGGTGTATGAVTSTTNGVTSRNSGAGSGVEIIPHGLGRIPKFLNISARNLVNLSNFASSDGTYNGTTTATVWVWTGSAGSPAAGTDTTNIIFLFDSSSNGWSATVTFDATNITITWTKLGVGAPATAQVNWLVG